MTRSEIDRGSIGVDGDRTEAAHRVHDETRSRARDGGSDFSDRIYDACGGLTMHHRNVTESGKRRQTIGSDFAILRRLVDFDRDPMNPRDLCDAAAVRAVDQNQQPAIARDRGGNYGLDRERPAALHQHAIVTSGGASQLQKCRADFADCGNKFGVARTYVAQHRGLDRGAGGQWPGSEEKFIGHVTALSAYANAQWNRIESQRVPPAGSRSCDRSRGRLRER